MNITERAAFDGRNIESGGGDQTVVDNAIFPETEYSTDRNNLQGIAALLPCGAENAISTKALVKMTGCSSARQLQERIAAERAQGAVILSSSTGGYYLPAEGEKGRMEIHDYITTLRARAINTLRAVKSAKAVLAVLDGQQRIDGEECGKT